MKIKDIPVERRYKEVEHMKRSMQKAQAKLLTEGLSMNILQNSLAAAGVAAMIAGAVPNPAYASEKSILNPLQIERSAGTIILAENKTKSKKIHKNKLYVCRTSAALKEFSANPDSNISKADQNWLQIGPRTYNTESGDFESPWPFGRHEPQSAPEVVTERHGLAQGRPEQDYNEANPLLKRAHLNRLVARQVCAQKFVRTDKIQLFSYCG